MTGKKVLKIFLKILIGIFLVLGCLCWFYAIYVELSGATTGGFIDLSNLFVWGGSGCRCSLCSARTGFVPD